ncbi:MAG: transporter, partial [Sphingobacteriaceae bacterium]
MSGTIPIFKAWASEWLIRITLFMMILPSLLLFGLSTANGAAAAGYYGIEPADVQYSMIVFYAAVAGFFALERRFFTYIATKEYFFISTALQIITSYICYRTHNLYVLFVFRFLQGMANCGSTSIAITLIFSRLKGERAREIGYSLFYCFLLCIGAFTTLITAPLLDAFDFNVLYKIIIFSYLPGAVLMFFAMNNVRLNRKFPLYQLDWSSFIIYASGLCLLGYVLVYGQQRYWFQDTRILSSTIASVILFATLVLRQKSLKRPYLDLEVFKYRNFKIGALMIFVLYICRGTLGVTSVYFAAVLGMDPIHIAFLMLANIAGIIIGVIISSRLVVLRKPIRLVWIYGFMLLLIFHVWMCFLFDTQADPVSFMLPL